MNAVKKILLTDNDRDSLFIVSRILNKYRNYNLTELNNAPAAIEKIKSEKFDLVLMDMCMPGMDGIKAIRLIRELPIGEKLPILLMMSSDLEEQRLIAFAAGANACITKPFSRDVLLSHINALMPEN